MNNRTAVWKCVSSGSPRGRCRDGVRGARDLLRIVYVKNKEEDLEYPRKDFRLQDKNGICKREMSGRRNV